jgi:hypothetical protein
MYDSLKITNGDISFDSLGQLEFITGQTAMEQIIQHKLSILKGDIFYNLNYGISVDFSQLKKTDKNLTLIQSAIDDALSDDSRISHTQIVDITDNTIILAITLTDDTVLNINIDKG